MLGLLSAPAGVNTVADRSTAGVVLEPETAPERNLAGGILVSHLAAELPEDLDDLSDAARPERMAFRQQPATRIDWDPPFERRLSRLHQLPAGTRLGDQHDALHRRPPGPLESPPGGFDGGGQSVLVGTGPKGPRRIDEPTGGETMALDAVQHGRQEKTK